MSPGVEPGAVVIRSADPERRLQGLRAALSLALGDRPAAVYLLDAGAGALTAPAGGEAAANLAGLRESGVAIVVEAGAAPAPAGVEPVSRGEALRRITAAAFQQTF